MSRVYPPQSHSGFLTTGSLGPRVGAPTCGLYGRVSLMSAERDLEKVPKNRCSLDISPVILATAWSSCEALRPCCLIYDSRGPTSAQITIPTVLVSSRGKGAPQVKSADRTQIAAQVVALPKKHVVSPYAGGAVPVCTVTRRRHLAAMPDSAETGHRSGASSQKFVAYPTQIIPAKAGIHRGNGSRLPLG
jgi:hypothetical protein